ncbi:MAG: BMP family ABC transporter substrate-binding protein [Firmicutes bacterium]|nr:BMP family ABC transporter substrate-binding protein [Bacillota bacterium]
MLLEEYRKARKLGNMQYKKAMSRGEPAHPRVLDELLEGKKTAGEIHLGTVEIPLHLVVGTKEAGRQNALSPDFLPLLDEDSEFAGKWMRLYDSQMEEGIHEPIIAYEYNNRFYVQEGSKRVSIMKYLEMPTIPGFVTRILPVREDTDESRKYDEFQAFYQKTKLDEILFSEHGSYGKLLKAVGKDWNAEWSEDEIKRLKTVFYHFSAMYQSMNGEQSPEVTGDAFLRCLTIFPYEELKAKSSFEIGEELKSMKEEIEPQALTAGVEHVVEPKEETSSLVTKILPSLPSLPSLPPLPSLPSAKKKLKAAFIYDGLIDESGWTYAHEFGRLQVAKRFKNEFTTTAFENIRQNQVQAVIQQAIEGGSTVIFTTTPLQMQATMKAALKHPEVFFFNCSLNYPYKSVRTYYARSYEMKFLLGLIAGAMAEENTIGYEANYPIYGTVADINAFAVGVQMVRPRAKVQLYWSGVKKEYQYKHKDETIILAKESMAPKKAEYPYGLYQQVDGKAIPLATGIINWGKFYGRILEFIADGTWKRLIGKSKRSLNYWWGLSAEVLELICSEKLPYSTKKLMEEFKRLISWGGYHPFEGVLYDQEGRAHGKEGSVLTTEEIITMDWLCENVMGSIPTKEQLADKAQKLVELQGIWGEMA